MLEKFFQWCNQTDQSIKEKYPVENNKLFDWVDSSEEKLHSTGLFNSLDEKLSDRFGESYEWFSSLNSSLFFIIIFVMLCIALIALCGKCVVKTHNRRNIYEIKNNIYTVKMWSLPVVLSGGGIALARFSEFDSIARLSTLTGIVLFLVLFAIIIFSKAYFNGEKYAKMKNNISAYVNECNELNRHIESLKSSYAEYGKTDYGETEFSNISRYKYKKKGLYMRYAPNVYDCSRQVCANAQKQPFKYICKYFNIDADEQTLSRYEGVLNNFMAAEEGKRALKIKKIVIVEKIQAEVPAVIRNFFKKNLVDSLGFEDVHLNELYFPQFVFRYVSAGGNSGSAFTLTMDISMLERFVKYLDANIKRRKSAVGQRALMTPKLRKHIKERDNYTCMKCGNSVYKEPNLLLEIDHIVPIAKGGMTEESNLQTLCWKCNRRKGSRME